jgi:hypothetical protein
MVMPYICTHLAFGKRVADALGRSPDTLGEPYVLGCFGPDLYFFDRLPPTPFIPHQKKHGNLLHAQDCFALFSALADASDELLHTYLLGFLTHIALDSTLHPYIEAKHRGLDHTRFEGVIDSIVYAETKTAIPYREILMRRASTDRIDALLADASKALCGASVSGAYTRSARKFSRLAPFLFDPKGGRFRAILRVERLFKKEGLLSAFLLAAERSDEEDCMNLSRSEWTSPWEPDRIRTESVPMLFDEAEALAVSLIRAYEADDREALNALLSGRTMQKGALPQ